MVHTDSNMILLLKVKSLLHNIGCNFMIQLIHGLTQTVHLVKTQPYNHVWEIKDTCYTWC